MKRPSNLLGRFCGLRCIALVPKMPAKQILITKGLVNVVVGQPFLVAFRG